MDVDHDGSGCSWEYLLVMRISPFFLSSGGISLIDETMNEDLFFVFVSNIFT